MTRMAHPGARTKAGGFVLIRPVHRTHPAVASARARGQMLVLFVISIFVLTGITAIVVDVSWYWANSLRV